MYIPFHVPALYFTRFIKQKKQQTSRVGGNVFKVTENVKIIFWLFLFYVYCVTTCKQSVIPFYRWNLFFSVLVWQCNGRFVTLFILYFLETEEQARQRFQTELEFVQCLANPNYLNCKSLISFVERMVNFQDLKVIN